MAPGRDHRGQGPTRRAGLRALDAEGRDTPRSCAGGLLARMVTIRLHLDDCGPGNGPLRVLPGSHLRGRLAPAEINAWAARASEVAVDCVVPSGGAVVMRPLLLHCSAATTAECHRRVIHLEYAAEPLPGGLEWPQVDAQAHSPDCDQSAG
jgi:hypothetical protein